MKIYFLRHGQADWPGWRKPDSERPLTEAGRKEVHAVAKFLVRLKAAPDLILTSPFPRAAETAEIAAGHLGRECRTEKLLEPGFGPAKWARLRRKYPEQDLLLVGHEPDFSQLIASLTGGQVKLAKAGVALVELAAPRTGRLRWLFPARFAR